MRCMEIYDSPAGELKIIADELGLCGVYFSGGEIPGEDEIFCKAQDKKARETIDKTRAWLDRYFAGEKPDFPADNEISMHLTGTAFREEVWEMLKKIPYGKTVTYGQIAEEIAKAHGIEKMSSRAVGGAVGKNPISIIVPCHRVLGAGKKLTGYTGGIDKKIWLLSHEGVSYR